MGIILLAVSAHASAKPKQNEYLVDGSGVVVLSTAAHWFIEKVGTDRTMWTVTGHEGLPIVLSQIRGGLDSLNYPLAAISTLHWIGASGSRTVIASLLAGLIVAGFLWLFSRWVHRDSNEKLGQQSDLSAALPRNSPKNVDYRPDAKDR